MTPAPIPADDAARVARLREYDILDRPTTPQFDAVVRLASMITEAPIVLISLVDADRQWFLSRHGLDATETSRAISFCGHVVAARAALVVGDAREDPRFADNPLVTGGPRVRFYAGVPLSCADSVVLGTLCAIDTRPRDLTASQLEALGLLAAQVVELLELRRTDARLRDERRELAEREAQLAIVLDRISEGVVLQDASGAILAYNPAATALLGLTGDQLRGRTSMDPRWHATRADGTAFPGHDHPAMVALRTGQPVTDVVMRVQRASGEQRWLSIDSCPLHLAGRPAPYAAITVFRDLTGRRDVADLIAHHQQVTAGTLAAGVGHEINNPLTCVLTNLGLAIELGHELTAEVASERVTDLVTLLAQARAGGERVRDIVRNLQAIVREPEPVVATDINAVVHAAVAAVRHELRARASVKLVLGDAPLAHTDGARIAQVLTNLLTNAAQAFRTADPASNQIIVRTDVGHAVTIEVSDNGPGIAPEVLPRIFDPFFTTQPVGGGLGLGLAIAHGAVTALGGELGCDSELGRGATFRVTLPASALPLAAPRSRGRMLVIDDERMILASFTRMFQADFEVVAYSDPRDALRCMQGGQDFDVVFCDLSMPHLSGMELYDRIAATRPELARRFVFFSGDMSRHDLRDFLARIPNERIEKPFDLPAIRQLACRYLAASSPDARFARALPT
jgi:two-component system, NtrC family, sensor kinase